MDEDGEWIPRNRAPNPQQAAAFARALEEGLPEPDENGYVVVAGIGWKFVPDGHEPPDLIPF